MERARAPYKHEGDGPRQRIPSPRKIVADVASHFELDSRATRQLQLFTDRLVESIRQHRLREERRREDVGRVCGGWVGR